MKKIIFIRHAKSSWTSGFSKDFDRPLNERGKRDAPFMAGKIHEYFEQVDGIIRSPSKRTKETSRLFIEEFGLEADQVIDEDSLYHGSLYDILDAVQSLPDSWSSAFLIAHNPGMTFTAEYFGRRDIDNVPTCGVLVVESEAKEWAYVNQENSKITTFEYPKKYFNS